MRQCLISDGFNNEPVCFELRYQVKPRNRSWAGWSVPFFRVQGICKRF